MIIAGNEMLVSLEGVPVNVAYAWGVETGTFIRYSHREMLGRHLVHAGNVLMIELLCAQRGMHLDVKGQHGAMMQIEITKQGAR